jgi:hypothetical protein
MMLPFEDLPLEKDQQDLLADLVEADRTLASDERQEFFSVGTSAGFFLMHPGLKRETVYPGDLHALAECGLLRIGFNSRGDEKYDVTVTGRRYYEWMRAELGEPIERVEAEVRRTLDGVSFRERHPSAYERWVKAESALWGAEMPTEFTTIGHACREALQLFVTDLIVAHYPERVNADPQMTVDRLRAVLPVVQSDAVRENLLAYFGSVSDLVQRQEHGAQKEHEALVWEDARRVVFQTAMVMFELDRALR